MSEQKRNPLVTLVKKSVGLPVGPSSCCAVPAGLTPAGDPASGSPAAQAKDEAAAGCCGSAEASAPAEGCCGSAEAIAPATGDESPADPPAASGCCG